MKKLQQIENIKPINSEFRLSDLNYLIQGGRPKEKYLLHQVFQHFHQDSELAKKLTNLLLKFENPNEYDKEKWTPLHQAVRYNQNKAVIYAQQIGQFNFHLLAGQQGLSLMHLAVLKSNYEIIEILIEEKVSLFIENVDGILPRRFALQSPVNLKMIKKYENQQMMRFLMDFEDIDDDESTQANKIQNLNVSQQSINKREANDVLITRPKVSLTYHVQLKQFNPYYLKCERFYENALSIIFEGNDLYTSMLLLLSLSNDKFPIKHIQQLVEQLNVTLPILRQDYFDIECKFEKYSKKIKKDLIYAIQDYRIKLKGMPNIFGEPKNQEAINNLKRFTSNKLEYDIKNYAGVFPMPQLMYQIQRLCYFTNFSFLICEYPKIKFQSNYLVLHQFECLNKLEHYQISESSRIKGQAIQKNHYGKLEFWERRYSENDKPFEWYQNYDTLKDIVTQYINHNSRILNIGCGNSNIPEDMYKEGYQWIVNLDFSKTVIEFMKEKYKSYPAHFQFVLADARDLPFPNESFDCVFDKGLLDAVLSGDYSAQNSKKVINHIYRALKKDTGVYIIVSHGFPEQRLPYLSKSEYNWKVTYSKVYKPDVRTKSLEFDATDLNNYHFIYVCKMDRYQGQTAAQVIGI
ncbi:unnamed protein product [Paramecium pentaurelia]|uniref:Methyltransferase domain-containing protein n=1 Tax=Paramecium pentaurelia TaxID=43138 RepID=A0A8S1WU87_9CILI|nr:unnamed protein product [Paramecium pentaurelia]